MSFKLTIPKAPIRILGRDKSKNDLDLFWERVKKDEVSILSIDHFAEDDTHMVEDFYDLDQPPEEEIQQEDLFAEDEEPETMSLDYIGMQEESPTGSTFSMKTAKTKCSSDIDLRPMKCQTTPLNPAAHPFQPQTPLAAPAHREPKPKKTRPQCPSQKIKAKE